MASHRRRISLCGGRNAAGYVIKYKAAGYVIKYKKQLQCSRIYVIIYHKVFSAI